jgi:hypothetical protein
MSDLTLIRIAGVLMIVSIILVTVGTIGQLLTGFR